MDNDSNIYINQISSNNIIKKYNNSNESKSNEEELSFTKSDTFDLGDDSNNNNLREEVINKYKSKKSKSPKKHENINRFYSNSRLKCNYGQNHLETVLETVNEVSCSKIDSSEFFDDNKNNKNILINVNIDNNLNDCNLKFKDENIFNDESENKNSKNVN